MNYDNLKTSLRAVNRKNVTKILRNMKKGKSYKIESFQRFFSDMKNPHYSSGLTLMHMWRYGLVARNGKLNRDANTKQARGVVSLYTISEAGEKFLSLLEEIPNLTYNKTNLRKR